MQKKEGSGAAEGFPGERPWKEYKEERETEGKMYLRLSERDIVTICRMAGTAWWLSDEDRKTLQKMAQEYEEGKWQ